MKRFSTLIMSLTIAGLLSIAAKAEDSAHDHAQHAAQASSEQMLTEGEIKKVDPEQKKLTIKHGEIQNLGMPPMTMVFRVRDVALLNGIKPGDKVQFAVEKLAEGFTVTRIQPAN